MEMDSLYRFLEAQESDYENALEEVTKGRKTGHWMWYIFPQIAGLGFSETSRYYAVKDLSEAKAYLEHRLLGSRLIKISQALLNVEGRTAHQIFGSPDDLKLQSCMTLFGAVSNANPVFEKIINKYFGGKKDVKTLELLEKGRS